MTRQTTVVLRAADSAKLGEWAAKPTSVTGQRESSRTVWAGEGAETGIWECEAGTFTATREGYDEFCQILAGRATLTEEGGDPVEIGPGDLLVTPAGWRGTWVVHEPLRKMYVVRDV